jgi:hypothetical protein
MDRKTDGEEAVEMDRVQLLEGPIGHGKDLVFYTKCSRSHWKIESKRKT